MALIIENKDMPKCCDDCFALDNYGDYPRCSITEEQRGYTFDTSSKRMDKCPLREGENQLTKEEAQKLYEKFKNAGHEAFSLHEIWLQIFWDGENPRKFDNQEMNK